SPSPTHHPAPFLGLRGQPAEVVRAAHRKDASGFYPVVCMLTPLQDISPIIFGLVVKRNVAFSGTYFLSAQKVGKKALKPHATLTAAPTPSRFIGMANLPN
ncbi:MAG: hypothetical protein AAF399_22700, partial [Bacteroidota bacterium]